MSDSTHLSMDNARLRQVAEERLSEHVDVAAALDKDEIRHLLHELKVHQIELELQNEELRDNQHRQLAINDELKQSRASFYRLYHGAPVGYVTLDAKGIILQANATLAKLVERDLHWIEGRYFVELLDPEDHSQFRYRFAAFFKHPEGKSMELRLQTKSSNPHYMLFRGRIPQAELYADGEVEYPTNGVNFSLTDITERKWAEEHLRQERNKLASIIDGTSEGFWQIGPDRCTIQVNDALCQMLGYERSEMIGQAPWEFTDVHNADILLQQMSKMSSTHHSTYEIELRTKNGRKLPALVKASTLCDATGNCKSTFAFITDISQRKEYEASLIEARRVAESANAAKSTFLANMSHELRTPLNAILGYAQILQQDPSLGEMQRQSMVTIKRSGEHLLTLINDLLDLAKIEAGRFELLPNDFSLEYFFNEISDMFLARAMEQGLDFYYHAQSKMPSLVTADETRLRQVCVNLLGNAMKFTQRGHVRLEAKYHAGNLIISVTDTGSGIPPNMHAQIFKPFVQTGENRYKQQGTGLGLAISHSLIKLMGGGIELASELGKGSCFTVSLPIKMLNVATTAQVVENLELVSGLRRIDGLKLPFKVLVVDDIAENRAILRGLLEPLGFNITEAADGVQALHLTTVRLFDIIFMDLVMPNMDGLTATRNILKASGTAHHLIVAVTARVFAEDLTACLSAGCRDHLAKPVNRTALLRVLQKYLPLEWAYSAPPSGVAVQVPAADKVPHVPLSTVQINVLNTMLQHGDIQNLIQYLERLIATPNYPTQAPLLLSLIKDFRLNDMQRILDAQHPRFAHLNY